MKVSPLADVKNNFSRVIDRLGAEPLFVTRKGRIVAVLEAIAEEDVEDFLLERSPKFRNMLAASARKKGGMSIEEFRKRTGL